MLEGDDLEEELGGGAGGDSFEGHDGVGDGDGGFLEGVVGLEGVLCGGELGGVDEAGDALHLAVELGVAGEDGGVLAGTAEVCGVGGVEPLVDGALLGMLDGVSGAFAERLLHACGHEEGDLPADVAGDGVAGGDYRFSEVRDGLHSRPCQVIGRIGGKFSRGVNLRTKGATPPVWHVR